MTVVKNRIIEFIDEYEDNLGLLNKRISDTHKRIEEIQLEIRYINEKELPEAVEKRVLDGDGNYESKLRKTLEKLKAELQSSEEEVIVLEAAIKRFMIVSAEKITKFEQLYREEIKLLEKKQYSKMMHFKKMYVDSIIDESKIIHEYYKLHNQLQSVQAAGGIKKNVYSELQLKNANNKEYLKTYDNVMLQLEVDTIKRLFSGNYSNADVDYLNEFKHKKDLS
jgi:hypothetical protein